MLTFEGLNAGLFVAANDVCPLRVEQWSLAVDVAQRLYLLVIALGVLRLIRRGQPVTAFVRSERDFFLKSDRPAAAICS